MTAHEAPDPAGAGGEPGASAGARNGVRGAAASLLARPWFEPLFIGLIVINALMLGVEAQAGAQSELAQVLVRIDKIFLAAFVFELAVKWTALGTRRFFSDGWNVFDVLIVGASFLPMLPGMAALRALRVLRVLRLIRVVPTMRRVVEALFAALPGIGAALAILAVFFYIGAVMATKLFANAVPELFGDLGRSTLTLFQLTLFDDWGNVVRQTMDTAPAAWIFFVIFTAIAAFAVLNLFIGVIVDAVQSAQTKAITAEVDEVERDVADVARTLETARLRDEEMLRELRSLRAELTALAAASRGGSPAAQGDAGRPDPPPPPSPSRGRRKPQG